MNLYTFDYEVTLPDGTRKIDVYSTYSPAVQFAIDNCKGMAKIKYNFKKIWIFNIR